MNDLEQDEAIEEIANTVEDNAPEDDEEHMRERETEYLQSSIWWFTSTACPLIAGTFGPLASAFNVCAIVQDWRTYVPPGHSESEGLPQADPGWLIAVNAVALVFAIIANLALLWNMARRVSFAIAQSIIIVGWMTSSVILIALVCVASSSEFRLQPKETHALSQAFYYAILAAVLYAVVALLMIATVWGAMIGRYPKEYSLSTSQRTLMLQTITFNVYLLVGAYIYKRLENWGFLDAVYWADFTLLTIGIGADFTPKTHTGRALLFPFAIGGLIIIGLIIGSIRSLVLERGKAKAHARLTEKDQEKVLAAMKAGRDFVRLGWFENIDIRRHGLTELQKREQEFHIMRYIISTAKSKQRWMGLALSATASACLWFLGALVFELAQHKDTWSYFVSLYFSFTSLLTIGYGDFQPKSNSAKPFFVFWSLLAVPTLTIFIGDLSDTVVKGFSRSIIWLGHLTVLPDKEGPISLLRTTASNIVNWRQFNGRSPHQHVFRRRDPIQGHDDSSLTDMSVENLVTNRISEAASMEPVERSQSSRNISCLADVGDNTLTMVIAREMQTLMKDLECPHPKEYSYSDWVYFLRLVGQDESNTGQHRSPPVTPHMSRGKTSHLGSGMGDGPHSATGQSLKWSWLGKRSPLMSSQSETEWILCKLTLSLEGEAVKRQSGRRRSGV